MTTRSFQTLLNEYLPNEMLYAEMIKRDWLLSNCEHDQSWKGGQLITPFKNAGASSISFGELVDSSDISESEYLRGLTPSYKQIWGALKLNHRDLVDHSGKIPESSFLKLVPNELDSLMDKMKQAVSTQLLIGSHFAKFTDNGTAGGVIKVDHIDRFDIGQKLQVQDNNTAAVSVYVIAITMDDDAITVSLTRGGAAADMSAFTTAQAAKCYHPGVLTNGTFNSLAGSLLSLANGGTTNLHSIAKTSSPTLQALNYNGSSWSATNILSSIFDTYTNVRSKGRGNATTVLLNYKHLGSIMKQIETQKGGFFVSKQPSTNVYGWTEIEVTSVKGSLKIVAALEMDTDFVMFLDMKSFKLYSNGGFMKRKAPDGREYFEVRNTTGFAYIVDLAFFGELILEMPANNAIVHSISYV